MFLLPTATGNYDGLDLQHSGRVMHDQIIAEVTSSLSPYRHAATRCLIASRAVVVMLSGKGDCPKCWQEDGYRV